MEKEGEWKMDERLALKYEIREMGKIVNFIGQKNIDVSKIILEKFAIFTYVS